MNQTRQLYVRGTTVDAARRYTERHKGTSRWSDFEAALTPAQRRLFEEPVRRRDWYELEVYAQAIDIGARTLAPEDQKSYLVDLGRFVMDDGVNSLYRAFFAIASPSFVLRGSALLWGMFFKGSRLAIEGRGKTWVKTAIHDATFCTNTLCTSISGGMISALEHAGAKAVNLCEHRCRGEAAGHDSCRFHFTWH
jgi:hypothetical protein